MLLSAIPVFSLPDTLGAFIDSFRISSVAPYLISIITAVVCGAAIGIERNIRQKEAGIRTHIIVALGSALIMVISKYGFFDIVGYADHVNLDGARLAAQVVTGISFLGAGIIVNRGTIKGLTTAAGVWTTAGIGLAAGAGMYGIAVYATIILLAVQIAIHSFLPVENTATTTIRIGMDNSDEAIIEVKRILKSAGCTIVSTDLEKKDDEYIFLFTLRAKKKIKSLELTQDLSESKFVHSVTM